VAVNAQVAKIVRGRKTLMNQKNALVKLLLMDYVLLVLVI